MVSTSPNLQCVVSKSKPKMPWSSESDADSYESDGSAPDNACFRCGRQGHWASKCYAKTDVDGRQLKKTSTSLLPPPSTTAGVYSITDLSGRIYVGKSSNINKRIQEHKDGAGTSFLTRFIKQCSTLTSGTEDDLESWERNETLEQMYRNGIQNVRGWMFTSLVLTEKQEEDAFKQICEKKDLCRSCGRNNHFADRCYAKSKADWVKK